MTQRRIWIAAVFFAFSVLAGGPAFAEERKPTWFRPIISIYTPPKVEMSTSPVFRSVDPQIIQKLINLLEEESIGKAKDKDVSSFKTDVEDLQTPDGIYVKKRVLNFGIALAESLGWEPVKHIRVISEQNLKQRLTTVARWDHEPVIRGVALYALSELKDPNDQVYFREALWSRKIGVRFETVRALQDWGLPEAIPLLREVAMKDESTFIRVLAASALARIGDAGGLEILRADMDDKDWMIRSLAGKALGETGTHEDYDRLLNQLSRESISSLSNDFIITELAIGALKLFPKKQAFEKAEKAAKKKKKEEQAQAPAEPAAPVVPAGGAVFELEPLVVTAPRLKIEQPELVDSRINYNLFKLIRDKASLRLSQESIDRSNAYKDMNGLEETPFAVRLKARYTQLGYLLTEGLAGTKDFQLVDQLVRLARDGTDTGVQAYALVSLAYTRDRGHLYIFENALRNGGFAIRFSAVEALQIWGYPEAVSDLVSLSRSDPNRVIQLYAAQGAWRLGETLGRDVVERSLDDQDWLIRAMAMRYMGELGTGRDYGKMLGYLGSIQPRIVQAEMCSSLLRLYVKKYEEDQLKK